jgi:hypothetical protein
MEQLATYNLLFLASYLEHIFFFFCIMKLCTFVTRMNFHLIDSMWFVVLSLLQH